MVVPEEFTLHTVDGPLMDEIQYHLRDPWNDFLLLIIFLVSKMDFVHPQ